MRPSTSSWLVPSLLLGLTTLMGGCVVRTQAQPVTPVATGTVYVDGSAEATLYPTTPMPEMQYEVRPPPPAWDYVWVDGYWDWNAGYGWAWSGGYWMPPRAGYVFIGPRYVYEGGRPVYYRGYWEGSGGYRDYSYRPSPQPAWRGTPAPPPAGWRGSPAASAPPP